MKLVVLAFFLLIAACGSTPTLRTRADQTKPKAERPEPPPRAEIPNVSPEVLFQMGNKAFQNKEYNKAHDYFQASSEQLTNNPKQFDAKVMALRSLERSGRRFEVEEQASALLKHPQFRQEFRAEIVRYRFSALESIGDSLALIGFCEEILLNQHDKDQHDSYKMRCQDWIESKLQATDLSKVASSSRINEFRAVSFYRLGEIALEERDQDNARNAFARAASLNVGDWSERARVMLEQLEAVRRVAPRTVGTVLPLTGRHANVSQRVLRGMQFGLGLYGQVPSTFKLAVVDSEGNPDNARRGVERLVKEDNVIAVVGSVLSRDAAAVATKASELGVPSIALSQRSGLTEIGPRVFRNALTSEMQVRYLVKTAMEDMGMKRFAVVFPNDQYGIEFTNLFWDEVLARGGEIAAVQTYSPKETDFSNVIQRLVGTYYIEARKDEYDQRVKDWSASLKTRNARSTPPVDLLPPIVNFDAVFIPDSTRALGQIAAMLSFNGVKDVKLLGTNLWNNPDLSRRAGLFANNLLFVDSFVSSEQTFQNSNFVKEYKNVFGENPGIFEIQGYDAALLLRQLIAEGANSRESLARELTRAQNIPGAMGSMSMTEDREIIRPLTALTLIKNEVAPFKPAGARP